ncbi:MAG: HEAT repeat domain-containing protein [Armatimonadetes bacterium]|nr:HEAT repeat domain-containing protein [Armatimonadota bacterium]
MDDQSGDYVERLIQFSLHHPIPSVPPMAAEALGKIGDKRAVEPLIGILKTSRDPGLLEAAAEALGNLKDSRAVPALTQLIKEATIPVRLKAVAALGKIDGIEAREMLKDIMASDPSRSVRNEAQKVLELANENKEEHSVREQETMPIEISEAHKRGITVTLTLVDRTLCEVEEWAKGRQVDSIFFREHNSLSFHQRERILSEIVRIRSVLEELRLVLRLEPSVEEAESAIRSMCAGLWEHLVELKAKYLRRYGEVPPDLAECLDPRADELIQGILHILDALKPERRD